MNWDQRIQEAKERGRFTSEDLKAANSWGCCSLAERLGISTSPTEGSRIVLGTCRASTIQLGAEFAVAVRDNKFRKAQQIHDTMKQLYDVNVRK